MFLTRANLYTDSSFTGRHGTPAYLQNLSLISYFPVHLNYHNIFFILLIRFGHRFPTYKDNTDDRATANFPGPADSCYFCAD